MSASISTHKGCKLKIARYPTFTWNAKGGGGSGQLLNELGQGRRRLVFDPAKLHIPAVSWRNTTLLFAPIFGANIDIIPSKLEGWVEQQTGHVELEFRCQFNLSIAGAYKAPPLDVCTNLTSEQVSGRYASGHGKRLDSQGYCELVGTTEVPRVDSTFMNGFLTLPTEAFARMVATIDLDST